ncbi:Anthranilate synthase component 1 [bioreactor metagenome]|uniref:Anthranilate synthase component 1 n=1 Tax=bioreactor metagenome TaxID=1076179 RepID=A0A644W0S9_9ZZZZ|nr:anthranilate synthase component I [Negativicutes bacterium]
MKIVPSYQEFYELTKGNNIIPVCVTVAADLDTPISVYYKTVGDGNGFMLESAESSRNFGRYSFIGAQPFALFTARSESAQVTQLGKISTISGTPLAALQQYMETFSFAAVGQLPPFAGGAVGYFAYETAMTWERNRNFNLPGDMILAELMFCQVLIAFDHLHNTITVIYLVQVEAEIEMEHLYQKALDEINIIIAKLKTSMVTMPDSAGNSQTGAVSNDEQFRSNYVGMVKKAKDYIASGDVFQVVLSQRFSREINCHPISVYRRLRRLNPSPYMFYINFGHHQVIGASPEMLVKVTNGKVETCPIAGTRPRGITEVEDAVLAEQLLNDVKEKAEHAMLVDLGRNDIGRVSIPGTVEVEQFMQVEKFSHVMHLVSKVSGRLTPQYNQFKALQACFPAGTVSGAPKVRAMEIVSELEDGCRGVYAGAVGYIDFKGNMDTCITIRTMVVEGGKATVQTGAGIVADSVPDTEYQELKHKAKVLFRVLEGDDGRDFIN